MKILITGFESTKKATNASGILVSSLIENFPKELPDLAANIELRIIGDSTHTVKEELTGLLKSIQPEFCLFIGQAPGRNNITLETIATNYRFTGAPLNVGDGPQGGRIEAHGADAYTSTLLDMDDMDDMVKRIKEAGIPASISRNAGNSLCNQILYHGLHYTKENSLAMKCGFLHIPALPEQVISRWPQHPFMPLAMSRKAVEIILGELQINDEYSSSLKQ